MNHPCHIQLDFDAVTDNEIEELIDSVRSAECASCHSLLAHPDDLPILERIEELDGAVAANAAEWPLIFVRVKGRPYCECCHLAGHATGKSDEGAKYHESQTRREFNHQRRLMRAV